VYHLRIWVASSTHINKLRLTSKGLVEAVRVLALVTFPSGLRFESSQVQTIPLSQFASEAGVLPDPCGGGASHGYEVYPTGVAIQSMLLNRFGLAWVMPG
jgi:hypothetical protein